ncbi:MAG: putative lipid II flippase FtsW, partial [Candidatus Firestonebacteria bacterium]
LFWLMAGSMLFLFCKDFAYENYKRLAKPLFIAGVVLLLLVFVPGLGKEVNGAKRWIGISFLTFQPSELMKLIFIIFFCDLVIRKQEKISEFMKGIVPYLCIIGAICVVLLFQKDLGAAMLICVLGGIIIFAAGVRIKHLLVLAIASVPFIVGLILMFPYRIRRILTFLDPWKDPKDTGFQIVQSFIAFGSGGILGKGLGKGTQKLFYLPEAHTDFIYAIIGEELGLVGALAVLGLFALLVYKGIRIALETEDAFGKLLAVGLTAYIGLQAFGNMSVVLGLMPTKGMTLPFISYGGSSLVVNMAAAGILMNIASRTKYEKSDHHRRR